MPRLRPDVVRRGRLIGRLSDRPFRLALVSAPAGFGKTTLVLDWLRTCPVPYVWQALSDLENDPQRFFSQIATGLRSVEASAAPRLRDALEVNAPLGVLSARLLDDLHAMDRELILVIDDYQRIESPDLHCFVARLPDLLPPSVRLVLVSRVDPPFSLARLRLNGDLVEIRERDLRFTGEEIRTFFESTIGLDLDEMDANALEARTEGWIAGLQMAAISLRHEPDVRAFVHTFTGSNLFVVDYLLEEVIQRQSPEIQRFLLRTSILKRFDARLCRAVAGMDDTEQLLAEVEAANLFLVSLDRERAWYRYHHLFAELLAARLRRFHPDEWDVLHERASQWWEAEGDVTSALQHAREMTSRQRLLLLLERHGYGMLDRSEVGAFASWAADITDPEAACYPRLLIARSWVHLLTERFVDIDSLLGLAEDAVERSRVPYSEEEMNVSRGMIRVLRAFALRLQGRCDESIMASLDALSDAPALDVRNRGLLYFNLGRGQAFLGETEAARRSFEQAYDCTLQSRTWYLVLGSTGYMASLVMQREGLVASLERMRAAVAFATERHLDDVPASGYLYHQLGRILLLQGDLDGAEDAFKLARDRSALGRVHDVLSNALIGQLRVRGARADWQAAYEILREFGVVIQTANPLQLDTNYEIERARLALLSGDTDQLDTWCSTQAGLTSERFNTLNETAGLLLIQARLNVGDLDGAASVIAWLDGEAERRGRRLTRLEVQIARAVLLAQRNSEAASAALDTVLRKSAAQQLVLPFRQYGEPMRRFLERALQGHLSPAGAAQARIILHGEPERPQAPTPTFRQPLAEPLTEREQEVLFYLSRQLSYQAIADALFVTHDTVKTHVKHIYAKLGAANRRDALVRGHQAGFLLADAPAAG